MCCTLTINIHHWVQNIEDPRMTATVSLFCLRLTSMLMVDLASTVYQDSWLIAGEGESNRNVLPRLLLIINLAWDNNTCVTYTHFDPSCFSKRVNPEHCGAAICL